MKTYYDMTDEEVDAYEAAQVDRYLDQVEEMIARGIDPREEEHMKKIEEDPEAKQEYDSKMAAIALMRRGYRN